MSDLHKAAENETAGKPQAERVQKLLDAGADVHELDANGETAFNRAAANAPVTGRLMTLHWLKQALAGEGAKGLNDPSGLHRSTLAQYMAKWLEDDEMEAAFADAIGRGMKADVPNASGWTPLMAAAAMGRVAAVRALTPHYSREALCTQALDEYSTAYKGQPVVYEKGLNALEIAQARVFQDEDIDEELGENLWECMDLIGSAIGKKT